LGTILVGYDTEAAAVGEALSLFTESPNFPLYALALEPDTCREALELLTEVHADVGVPATLFVCGRTLLHALDPVRAAKDSGLFDVQQHTFSHVPFKDIVYSPGPGLLGTIAASPPEALLEELAVTSRLIHDHVGGEPVVGVRTPFGYHRGLRDRPDLLEVVRAAGLRYVTSWGRNEENGNPTPWVQPFAYVEEGYPDILELPFQFWLDVVWFDQHGYDNGSEFLAALKGAVDEVAERDLVYGACFHDWVAIASDERRVGWLRGFFRYALEQGVEVTTYTDYWRRVTGG
jgi:peptidoglycan/xylan/chitin deacetylase (PgdA/CDA1 family)